MKVIIGGGLAGWYHAYRLIQSNPKQSIYLYEKQLRYGGRIETKHISKNVWFDTGAARIPSIHTRVLTLIKELGLSSKLIPYEYTNRQVIQTSTQTLTKTKTILHETDWKAIAKALRDASPSKSAWDVIHAFGGYDIWMLETGYEDDFRVRSANDFGSEWLLYRPSSMIRWYHLVGGMEQIIDELVRRCRQMGVHSYDGMELVNVDGESKSYHLRFMDLRNGVEVHVDNVKSLIMAVPVWSLERIPFFRSKMDLECWGTVPLVRVFGHVKNSWKEQTAEYRGLWGDRTMLIGRQMRGQCLGLGVRTSVHGWLEVQYIGNKRAYQHLMNRMVRDREGLMRSYGREGDRLYGLNGGFDDMVVGAWREGYDVWMPGTRRRRDVMRKMSNDWRGKGIIFVGSSWSQWSAWMEGALEGDISRLQGGKKNMYTMEEVSGHKVREDGWIVIEGKVYDVTEWIPLHPGGDAILAGLGKDATVLWRRVHPDLSLVRKVMRKYYIGTVKNE